MIPKGSLVKRRDAKLNTQSVLSYEHTNEIFCEPVALRSGEGLHNMTKTPLSVVE